MMVLIETRHGTKLVRETGWSGEFLAGAYKLTSQMGLLREKSMNDDNINNNTKKGKKVNQDDPLHIKIAMGSLS